MEKSVIKLLLFIIGLLLFIIFILKYNIIPENSDIKTDTGRIYKNVLELKK